MEAGGARSFANQSDFIAHAERNVISSISSLLRHQASVITITKMTDSNNPSDPTKFSWTQDVEDEIEKNYGGPVELNFKEMLQNADQISNKIAEQELKERSSERAVSVTGDLHLTPRVRSPALPIDDTEESLDDLVAEADQLSGFQAKDPNKYQMTRARPPLNRPPTVGTENESFTSQRETAEMRNDIEILSKKLSVIEKTLEAILKEREALPSHFKRIQESMNQQLTLMSDKINNVLEDHTKPDVATVVKETVESVRTDANENLAAMRSLALASPSTSSPLAKSNVPIAGKRRFKPMK